MGSREWGRNVLADSPPDEEFDIKVEDITGLYISALESYKNGERTISIDEMTNYLLL
jgi:hypothetical protein